MNYLKRINESSFVQKYLVASTYILNLYFE